MGFLDGILKVGFELVVIVLFLKILKIILLIIYIILQNVLNVKKWKKNAYGRILSKGEDFFYLSIVLKEKKKGLFILLLIETMNVILIYIKI